MEHSDIFKIRSLHQYDIALERAETSAGAPQALAPAEKTARDRSRTWPVTLCLLTPIACAVIRKLTPDQPASVETAGAFVIIAVLIWCLMHSRAAIPRSLSRPLGILVFVHVVFLVIGLFQDWRIAGTALFTRLAPMAMIVVCAACVRSVDDLRRAFRPVILIMLLQLPFALQMILTGNTSLPPVLQAIEQLADKGLDQRMSVYAFSGLFSTPAIFSTSATAVLFLIMALGTTRRKRWEHIFLALASLGLLLMIYLTVRRGMFFLACAGLIFYSLAFARGYLRIGVVLLFALAALYTNRWIDSSGLLTGTDVEMRSDTVTTDLQLDTRIGGVFVPIVSYWMEEQPLGTFLGNGGAEAYAFGVVRDFPVEVLAAVWVLEFGIAGAVICSCAMVIFLWRTYKLSLKTLEPSMARILALFCFGFFGLSFFKEASAFSQVFLGNLIFWSVPGIVAGISQSAGKRYLRAQMKPYPVAS